MLFKERRLVLSDKSQLFTVGISPADHTQGESVHLEGGLLIGQFFLVSLVLTRVADFVWTWNISHSTMRSLMRHTWPKSRIFKTYSSTIRATGL